MRQWFTDIEIVKLTMIIAATDCVESQEMSFPRSYSEARMSFAAFAAQRWTVP